MTESVLIVGAGVGLSASLAKQFFDAGMHVTLVARDIKKIEHIAAQTNAELFSCDASEPEQVIDVFKRHDSFNRPLDLVIYNPSARVRGPINELDIKKAKKALEITGFGAFLVAQQASQRMLKQGHGSIFFTGATAGVKGFANSSVFAMGKFALRGLAQALARELHPKNIHIGHFIIDGGINLIGENEVEDRLDADAIAQTYLQFHKQNRSAWSWEIELRPWVENF